MAQPVLECGYVPAFWPLAERGGRPILLVRPMQDTAFECICRMDVSPGQGRRRGQKSLNPDDPYGRHHMFLPFNHKLGRIYKDAVNVWEVGGSGEYEFSEPVYLSEKNVYFPNK